MKGNKGEWSEVYVFLKLLADGKLYAADADLNIIQNIYYPIIKIIKNKIDSNWEYVRNGKIKVVDGNSKKIVLEIPIQQFTQNANLLLKTIKNSTGAFAVPSIETFLRQINWETIKSNPNSKPDITLVVHDLRTGFDPVLKFSIKSQLGGSSTLLNPSRLTNFIYKVIGVELNDNEIEFINKIESKSKVRDRIMKIKDMGGTFKFEDVESEIFKLNMQVIDSNLPFIISWIVLSYYEGKATDLLSLLRLIEQINPCNYNLSHNHSFYSYKIKAFLTDIALGMVPSKVWHGHYDANGGYIIVRNDGEIVCYHIYNKNEFEDYLLKNTKLETPSTDRYGFGKLYKNEQNNLFIKLNLQIRFID